MSFKAGATVRLIQPEIKGQVKERRVTAADDIEVLVAYTAANGELHERWFANEQLEEVVE